MAGNIFLFIDGIPGESTSEVFRNWIDIGSFSFGNSMEIDQDSRPGSGAGMSGAADPGEFTFDTKMSVASVVLLQACALGAVIPRVRLVQCNVVNELMLSVSDYALGDSIVCEVSINASGGDIPGQSFSLNYGSVIWRYHCYNHYNSSQRVAMVQREWSVISATPEKADKNAHRAIEIARGNAYKIGSDSHAYINYKEEVKVPFKEGPDVNMPKEFGKEVDVIQNKRESGFSKMAGIFK